MNLISTELNSLWAKSKPYHPLWKHSLDTAAVSLALCHYVGEFEWESKGVSFLVAIHDLGKIDPYFQHQEEALSTMLIEAGFNRTADTRCRHERITAKFIRKFLTQRGLDLRVADTVAIALAAHHGFWETDARDIGAKYSEAQMNMCKWLADVLEVKDFPKVRPKNLSAFGMRLSGHIVLCDWIASNEAFYTDFRLACTDDPIDYFSISKIIAIEWIQKLNIGRGAEQGNPEGVVDFPRPIQSVILKENIPASLIIIEAPMGEGKTEAAWILAEKWRNKGYRGMYMALPTMATSDNLHNRYKNDYLEKLHPGEDVRLVHGMAWLRDKTEPEKSVSMGEADDDSNFAQAWFRPTRRAMLAAHGVGTVDQAMLAAMNAKFGFLRLYGLFGKVLIIDEVHAYDAYINSILCNLLRWCACLSIPVILLSATLSISQRNEFIEAYGSKGRGIDTTPAYPLITIAESGTESYVLMTDAISNRTLKIRTHKVNMEESGYLADMALEMVNAGGCCCIILNTVKRAQKVFKELKLDQGSKLLIHSRFTANDRERITSLVLEFFGKNRRKRPEKFVVVATQIVEQSLDIDFDHMISEIAPIDLLLQRSGRLHRHYKRQHDPELHVLIPQNGGNIADYGGTAYVYAEKPLLRTYSMLSGVNGIKIPSELRVFIERCYGKEEWEQNAIAWELIRNADLEWDSERQKLSSSGSAFSLRTPSEKSFMPVNNDPIGDDNDDGNGWRAQTRLGANERTALFVGLRKLDYLIKGEISFSEVKELYRHSFKLPAYLIGLRPLTGYIGIAEAKGKLRGVLLLALSEQGIWQGNDNKGNDYEICYNDTLGLEIRRLT